MHLIALLFGALAFLAFVMGRGIGRAMSPPAPRPREGIDWIRVAPVAPPRRWRT